MQVLTSTSVCVGESLFELSIVVNVFIPPPDRVSGAVLPSEVYSTQRPQGENARSAESHYPLLLINV